MSKEKVVLAYSGGLDTSVCIRYLQLHHNLDVISLTVDCGQKDNFADIENRALKMGVVKHIFEECTEEFVQQYVLPSIKSNGLYEEKYPLATALARPLISAKLVDVAHSHGARIVAHGCTGKGNDQIRFDATIRALDPQMTILSPIRDMNLSRDLELKFAAEQGIRINLEAKKFSIDENIWGRAIEGGRIEDAGCEPPQEAFEFVRFDDDRLEYMEIEFEQGIPICVDNQPMHIIELIKFINDKAGSLGVGIVDHMEDRAVGIKSREIYEAPAAVVLIEAHKDLEKLVLTANELRFKRIVDEHWSWLVYSGLWKEPLRSHLDKFIDSTQKRVSGKVRLRMQRGSLRVVGRESKYSLYRNSLATYTSDSTFDQTAAKGFVELWSLQSSIANTVDAAMRLNINQKGGGKK
jgi:argininosuccinate synthase